MTENTYYKPRLVIGDKEITKGMSGNISFTGNSRPNTCSCKITDPQFQNYKLYNEELKIYLRFLVSAAGGGKSPQPPHFIESSFLITLCCS